MTEPQPTTMETPFTWTCPYCGRDTTITNSYYRIEGDYYGVKTPEGYQRAIHEFVVCPNPDCEKFEFTISLLDSKTHRLIKRWRLVPPSDAKVFPDYIPQAIRADYLEACLIKELSPKAAAALARRCLQGMIRDFWKIRKHRLIDEVDALKKMVDPLVWKAIDSVRKVGNIGTHMEKDVNLIIDVEPKEASQLLTLIEYLIHEWYIARYEREENLKAVVQVADDKDKAKQLALSASSQTTQKSDTKV